MPQKNQTRVKLAPNIWQDASGIDVEAVIGTGPHKRRKYARFDLGTSVAFMKSWQIQKRAELDQERGAPILKGTFTAEMTRRVAQLVGKAQWKADRSHLKAWVPIVGAMKVRSIQVIHLQAGITAFETAGAAAKTLVHRVRVIREMWKGLYGPDAVAPIRGLVIPTPPEPTPTAVPLATIRLVAASLKRGKRTARGYGSDSKKAHAWFLVRALTAARPCQIARAEPGDVDLVRKTWWLRSAKGSHSVQMHLNDEMVAAWRTFIALDAWGAYDSSSFSKTCRRHGWPAGTRPYTLRHTFAIDHLERGTPLDVVQGLLGHKHIDTTRRFYAPQVAARLRMAVKYRRLKLA